MKKKRIVGWLNGLPVYEGERHPRGSSVCPAHGQYLGDVTAPGVNCNGKSANCPHSADKVKGRS